MSNHLSFDVSLKVKKSDGVGGYAMHVMRDADDGINHGNDDIDSKRTKYNIKYAFNDDYGRTMQERYERRMQDYDGRTSTGKRKPLRKDAVVMRPMVIQPPASLFHDKSIDEQRVIMDKFSRDALAFVIANFGGTKNIVGACAHMDETNPHLHVAFMPMTDDGRLSQKDFFPNPLALKQMHQSFRSYMVDKGWEIELENKHEDSVHYELGEYKRNAVAIDTARAEYTRRKRELESDDKAMADLRAEIEHEVKMELYGALYSETRNVVSVTGSPVIDAVSKQRCNDLLNSVVRVSQSLGDGDYVQAAHERHMLQQQRQRQQAKPRTVSVGTPKHK